MELRILRTKKDHAQALAEVERLIALDPARGTPDGDALEVLSILVERYEKEHFSIDAPTPVEAIEFRMDQRGLRHTWRCRQSTANSSLRPDSLFCRESTGKSAAFGLGTGERSL